MKSPDTQPWKTKSAALSAGDLRGVFLPIPTPFDADGDIDFVALRSNIARWNESGISGYVILGSTGERVHLDEREYEQVIEATRETVPADLLFIVGAGQESRRGTVNEIKRAAAVGADAVLVITPHFYRAAITQQALIDHYTVTADASPVPVILYSMPDLTGVKIDPETAAQLGGHDNIVGIKDSSADITKFRETVEHGPEDFAVLTGNGTVFYEALCAGARGAILAVGCVATSQCLEILSLTEASDDESAERLQHKLTPLALAVTKRYGIGGLKAALDLIGFAGGLPRAPLQPVSDEVKKEISELLEQTGELSTSLSNRDELAGIVKS